MISLWLVGKPTDSVSLGLHIFLSPSRILRGVKFPLIGLPPRCSVGGLLVHLSVLLLQYVGFDSKVAFTEKFSLASHCETWLELPDGKLLGIPALFFLRGRWRPKVESLV